MCLSRGSRKSKKCLIKDGMTFVELVVAMGIFLLILGVAYVQLRNSRLASTKIAQNLSSQMEMRNVTDRLTELLNNATEIVKPLEGSSLPFLVMKNLRNNLQILYLEKPQRKFDEPFVLVFYTDKFQGPDKEEKKIISGKIKSVTFTNTSSGLVLIHLTMVDQTSKELSSITEVPLSNFSSIDEYE